MKKLDPKEDMENLNNFDIPFNIVVEKMLDFMGNLPEGDDKHSLEVGYVNFLRLFKNGVKIIPSASFLFP